MESDHYRNWLEIELLPQLEKAVTRTRENSQLRTDDPTWSGYYVGREEGLMSAVRMIRRKLEK